jgi:ribosomal protein S18 acetylase RimI-like enzyme
VCRFALGELLAAHGHVALSVDWDNYAAIRLYSRLGLAWQDVSVAAVRQ